jgi:CyaY protein
MRAMMSEKQFRERLGELFGRIEKAFDSVDPDQVECTVSQGALTLLFADGTKCILSGQPSVRQLWMAVAAQGVAFHFNFEEESGTWMDDKGRGIEATAYLAQYVREKAGLASLRLEGSPSG